MPDRNKRAELNNNGRLPEISGTAHKQIRRDGKRISLTRSPIRAAFLFEKRKEGIAMKIKWILRFKNKAVLMALIAAVVAFIYQVVSLIGITPSVSESEAVELLGLLVNILVMLGIVVDPTTAGINDSDMAMTYTEPRPEIETEADEEE